MYLGECLHAVQLEKRQIIEIPPEVLTSNGQRRGKRWEEYRDMQEALGNLILPSKDLPRIKAMSENMSKDPEIRRIIEADGYAEHNLFWTHEETGISCRARLDKVAFGSRPGSIIGDIKTTNIDVTVPDLVGAKIAKMQYHRQAASYFDAAKIAEYDPKEFVFIFVKNKEPFTARAWTLSQRDIDLGRKQNDFAYRDLKKRLESNDWLGAGFGILNRVSLPTWAYDNDTMDVSKWSEFTSFETSDPEDNWS
jgi:hypothetical protein